MGRSTSTGLGEVQGGRRGRSCRRILWKTGRGEEGDPSGHRGGQEAGRNPQIGAFPVHATLKQNGFDLSRTTCGRILAQVREIYGYDTPKSGGRSKKAMPFTSETHHRYWTADVRYLDISAKSFWQRASSIRNDPEN